MSTYEQPDEGEWVQPITEGYKMACCDCGLVHSLDFRVVKGRAQFRVWRNNRSTAMIRRHRQHVMAAAVEREGKFFRVTEGQRRRAALSEHPGGLHD